MQTLSAAQRTEENPHQVAVAIARELSAFMWAIGQAGPCDRPETEAVWSLHRASQRGSRSGAKVHRKRRSPGSGVTLDGVQRFENPRSSTRGRHLTEYK